MTRLKAIFLNRISAIAAAVGATLALAVYAKQRGKK